MVQNKLNTEFQYDSVEGSLVGIDIERLYVLFLNCEIVEMVPVVIDPLMIARQIATGIHNCKARVSRERAMTGAVGLRKNGIAIERADRKMIDPYRKYSFQNSTDKTFRTISWPRGP